MANNIEVRSGFQLRPPSKYACEAILNDESVVPPENWLFRTWTVTHSTLKMWRTARNVRITYKALEDGKIDDIVEYEKKTDNSPVKRIEGVDKPDKVIKGAWNWRGKGWLKIASSHWEILGYGERPREGADVCEGQKERWVVTWFAPTLFTAEGIDIYCDHRTGMSRETHKEIMSALMGLESAPKVVDMVRKEMLDVDIQMPWKERQPKE